jgi:hypothetical protein
MLGELFSVPSVTGPNKESIVRYEFIGQLEASWFRSELQAGSARQQGHEPLDREAEVVTLPKTVTKQRIENHDREH